MESRRVLGLFTGTHITVMVCAALLAPGAVYAIATTAVAITDPVSGHQAAVDAGRRVYTLDAIAYYKNNPANQRDIYISNTGNVCENAYQYTIPAGSGFIITAMSGLEYKYSDANNYSGIFVNSAPNCTGTSITSHVSSVSTTAAIAPIVAEYGVGIPVPAGSTISVFSINNFGYTYIHGYLVPASAVPGNPYPTVAITSSADLAAKLNHSR